MSAMHPSFKRLYDKYKNLPDYYERFFVIASCISKYAVIVEDNDELTEVTCVYVHLKEKHVIFETRLTNEIMFDATWELAPNDITRTCLKRYEENVLSHLTVLADFPFMKQERIR